MRENGGSEQGRRIRHPRYRTSVRWWIAGRSIHALLLMALAALTCFAFLIAVLWMLTAPTGDSLGARFGDGERIFDLTLDVLRACVGTDSLDPEPDCTPHQLLATLASVTGALAPAVLLGIILIKMFSLRPFIWRKRASISHAWTADFPGYSRSHANSDDGIIAVRFYNRFDNLSLVDLRARAHLRYLERSPHDGTLVIYKKWLQILDEEGEPADERYWLAVERGAPFTVWIPVDAPVPELPFTRIQGKDLAQSYGVKLLVRVTARTVGLGTEVADERWFDLAGGDFELGRFVGVQADTERDVWKWDGWQDFDALLPKGPAPVPAPAPSSDGADATVATDSAVVTDATGAPDAPGDDGGTGRPAP
ncbi:hypothetical protein [Streptomyces sp. TS71-3]|uniref:hypothetical protein n=1 Tax=Streptomyces sp. TS71-3 TaxID=2733862 RepID=UPI001B2C0E20|nr:hypothetical protein [Streptomyces sp. TS71-3]GHJ36086.1 hypothetical protein Sm713_16950 [Streptomyces sp. TS71-3]